MNLLQLIASKGWSVAVRPLYVGYTVTITKAGSGTYFGEALTVKGALKEAWRDASK
jgi:hypothetical protein